MTGVGVEVVGAESRPRQLGRRVSFEDRPLAGTEHSDRRRTFFLQTCLAWSAITSTASSQLTGSNRPPWRRRRRACAATAWSGDPDHDSFQVVALDCEMTARNSALSRSSTSALECFERLTRSTSKLREAAHEIVAQKRASVPRRPIFLCRHRAAKKR